MTKNFSNVLNMNNWGRDSVYIQTKHCVSSRTSDLDRRIAKKINLLNFKLFIFYIFLNNTSYCSVSLYYKYIEMSAKQKYIFFLVCQM